MNRFSPVIVVLSALLLVLSAAEVSKAQTAVNLSEAHLARISQNCVEAKTTLNRLHVSDTLLRVNRGKLYELISSKLMAPLSSRIALNRLDGVELTATSLEYNRQIDTFRASYKQYEESMSEALKVSCDQPAAFYESVRTTRGHRQKLYQDTAALTDLLRAYKVDFEAFAKAQGAER